MNVQHYDNLTDFLTKHYTNKENGEQFTHTKIPSKQLKINGGSYHINPDELPVFYNLYCKEAFGDRKHLYLTEKQNEVEGPLAIDLDFRYPTTITTRQHTNEHISDIISIYLAKLSQMLSFNGDQMFSIYVMEKKCANVKEDVTKDGIHILFGIHVERFLQIILREKVMQDIQCVLNDLGVANPVSAVIDEGISKGSVNWPLYGSRKPENEPYKITYVFHVSYDEIEGDFNIVQQSPKTFDVKEHFHLLSVQYMSNPKFDILPSFETEYNRLKEEQMTKTRKPIKKIKAYYDGFIQNMSSTYSHITDMRLLDHAINEIMADLRPEDYSIKELHEYTQILPAKYYEPGSHLLNRQVAFGLKHKDDKLFLSWIKLRSKASDFDFGQIPVLYDEWSNFSLKEGGITHRSIIYWAKQDAYEDYERVKNGTIDHYIENTLFTAGDWDYANVLYSMYKDKFVCTNLKNGTTWYMFKKHRWEKDDGMTLRRYISTKLFQLYSDKQSQLLQDAQNYDSTDETHGNIQRKIKQLANILIKFKDSGSKNKIMREASELFYDGEFIKSMDSNPYLLCFENGVYDFKQCEFRQGYPSDYVSKSTGVSYVKIDPSGQNIPDNVKHIMDDINTFMNQIFPEPELCRYMWDHLASILIGFKKEQAFNVYKGSGGNGKSILTELLSLALGEYKGTVPVNLITDKRSTIGGTTSELMQLKAVRCAVMQELTKGAVMNEGIMKEMTSCDPLLGRALWSDSETFIPQFSLIVCTNVFFKMNSNDDGTWRRMKIVEFMSKFVSEGEEHTHDNNYIFPKDKDLKNKLKYWAPIFISMLVNIASRTQGEVIDCPQVVRATNRYRETQDCLSRFINNMIVKEDGMSVKKTELNAAFKMWFTENHGNERMPKLSELEEVMDKKYGQLNSKTGKWKNIRLIPPNTEFEDDEEDIN